MIHLIDNYYLSADHLCYQLGILRTRKDGRSSLENMTYHLSIIDALNAVIRRTLHDKVFSGEIASIKGAVSELERLKSEITSLVQGLDTTNTSPQDFSKAEESPKKGGLNG